MGLSLGLLLLTKPLVGLGCVGGGRIGRFAAEFVMILQILLGKGEEIIMPDIITGMLLFECFQPLPLHPNNARELPHPVPHLLQLPPQLPILLLQTPHPLRLPPRRAVPRRPGRHTPPFLILRPQQGDLLIPQPRNLLLLAYRQPVDVLAVGLEIAVAVF